MGYPMTYQRVVNRNTLTGGYEGRGTRRLIAGDLRRLEVDQRDELHLGEYARHAGITPEQARAVLDLFFGDVCERCQGSGVAEGERHGETTVGLVEDPCSGCGGTGRTTR